MTPLHFLGVLGIAVYEVDGLSGNAIYVQERDTLFIPAGLTDDQHRRLCDDFLSTYHLGDSRPLEEPPRLAS